MRAGRIAAWVAGILLVALYGYSVVAAVGNLVGMSGFLGAVFGPLPWMLLWAGAIVPVVALVVTLILGRGRTAGMRLLLLATGLCVAAAIQLEIMHLIS